MNKWQMLFHILIVLEIVAVEFISIWCLSKKKHSLAASLGLYAGITVVLFLVVTLVGDGLPGFGNASGKYLLFCLVYLIPVMGNYGGHRSSRVIIAFYSFSYALMAFSLAARISRLFWAEGMGWKLLLVQTVLLAATLPPYLMASGRWMMDYVHKTERRVKTLLVHFTIAVFVLVALFNFVLVEDSPLLELAAIVLLVYVVVLAYRLAVSYMKADGDNQELTELASTDRLTGLGNRMALRRQADLMLREGKPFYMLFLDLDDFKSINDRFGHNAGDEYLCGFADALRAFVGQRASCFRLAGDEFICLTWEEKLAEELQDMAVTFTQGSDLPPFIGLSVGMARFPEDGTTIPALLELADRHMYEEKQRKMHQQSNKV